MPFSEAQKDIFTGWQRHIHTDAVFHNHAFFKDNEKILSTKIQEQLVLPRPIRSFALAHIGIEMLLDYLLLQNKQIESTAFYQQLESADSTVIADFLQKSGIEETEKFQIFYKGFCDAKFLNNYTSIQNLVVALNNLCRRFWQTEIPVEQQDKLLILLDNALELIQNQYQFIFEDIKNYLSKKELVQKYTK